MKKLLIALLSVAVLAGCGNKADRDAKRIAKREDRLRNETAMTLGVDASQVSISNVSGNMYGYRWFADVSGKRYTCQVLGGNFMSFGQTVAAQCNPAVGNATPAKKKKKK